MIYLPPHKASLHLTHNQHKAYYETVEVYLRDNDMLEFRSAEEQQACIDTNEIWELQWYPNTPISFYAIAAPTLEALIEYAKELQNDKPELQ